MKLELVYAYMTESIDHGHAVKEVCYMLYMLYILYDMLYMML